MASSNYPTRFDRVRNIINALYYLNNTSARIGLRPETLCNILYSVKSFPDCAEVSAILHALLPHFIVNITAGVRWTPEDIEDMLYSLYIMPTSPEAVAIYLALQPQIVAASMLLPTRVLGYAFYLLRYLPESVDMAEQSRVFLLGLQTRIQDERKLLDPPPL